MTNKKNLATNSRIYFCVYDVIVGFMTQKNKTLFCIFKEQIIEYGN